MVGPEARATRRALLAVAAGAPLLLTASAQATIPTFALYEWMPNGSHSGPQLVIQYKPDLYVTGRYGLQCGNTWIFAIYSGGFALNPATGALSGTIESPAGAIGKGTSYTNAQIDFFDFKSAGPVTMTIDAQVTDTAVTGTISAKIYRYAKAHKHGKRRIKRQKLLATSCAIPFEAVGHPSAAALAPPHGSEAPIPENES